MTAAAESPEIASAAVPAAAQANRGLFRFAVFFAAFTLFHIKFGAMVVSTGSGMAFTDWPLANGSLWPPDMDLSGYFEHLHRFFGATVGLLGIGLLVWVWRADGRRWLVHLCGWLLALIVVQGLLGAWGVLSGQEGGLTWAPAAIGHGVLGQVTLCVQVFIAFALSTSWWTRVRGAASTVRTTRKLSAFALGCVFFQLLIGAIFRHTNVDHALWLHIGMAMVVSIAILIANAHGTARFGAQVPAFKTLSRWIYTLLMLQLVLGFVTLAIRRFKDPSNIEYLGRSAIVSSHVLIGATLFLTATLLVARAWRNLEPVDTHPTSGVA